MLKFAQTTATFATATVRKASEWEDHLKDVRAEFARNPDLLTLKVQGRAGSTFLYHRDDPAVGA